MATLAQIQIIPIIIHTIAITAVEDQALEEVVVDTIINIMVVATANHSAEAEVDITITTTTVTLTIPIIQPTRNVN